MINGNHIAQRPGEAEASAAQGAPSSLVNPLPWKRPSDPTTEELLAGVNRSLPFSNESERGLLSCCLQDPARTLAECLRDVPVDAFYHYANRTIYETLLDFHNRGAPLDIATLTHSMRDQGTLEKVGGAYAISELYTFIPVTAHLPFYKKVMLDKLVVRRMIHACSLNIHYAYEHGREFIDEDVDSFIAEAEDRVKSVREGFRGKDNRTKTMSDCVLDHLDYMEALSNGSMTMFPVGLPSFDKRAGGVASDEYCLITGPTKSGKTTFAQKIFQRNAANGVKCAYYSHEVSSRTIGGRAVFATGHAHASMERHGFRNLADQSNYSEGVREVQDTIGKTAIVVNASGMTIEEQLSDMRQKWDDGVRLFIVDYIGKVYSAKTFTTREREVSFMSNQLFNFTKRPQQSAAVICLAQQTDDGLVSQCRGLEHDCDMHLKIVRVFVKEKNKDPVEVPNRRAVLAERGRSIESGYRIPIYFDGAHYKFEECRDDGREIPE